MTYQTSAMDPKHAVNYTGPHAHHYAENMAPDLNINGAIHQFQGLTLGHGMTPAGNGMGPMNPGHAYMFPQSQDGPYVFAPMPPGPMGMDMLGHAAHPYSHAAPYLPGHGHVAPFVPYPMAQPFTPGRPGGTLHDRTNRAVHSEVPDLDNRRGSYSTTESTPATPFYSTFARHEHAPRVAVRDRSAYTTPSPQQMGTVTMYSDPGVKRNNITSPLDRTLDELLAQSPAIPKAVPAVFTPSSQMKTLEQSLENRIPGNRNVYIRGLHPTTDDELLLKFASRFGEVETSKAIIDTSTGACKGFGFAKFYNARDSDMCIRGFHRLGYEVGFARESFNSRLKAEGDEGSTNLYISNLPKNITEVELGAIFMGYTIVSSKILRDSLGNSRGVGFARFESREICEEIIREFSGVQVGNGPAGLSIRFADTPSQKELKRVTAERRQFRTNEYNIGAYGTPLVGLQPNMFNQSIWKRTLSQQVHARTTEAAAAAAAVSSEDSDEGVTIHAESNAAAASTQSSPLVKKAQN
ncbi:sporulation-specific protein [Sodiomyces alkalinus F11]|uniref:Sporulation-specific protein n=1 Tax=Sodiomyces alkalinus (strain CBS 110278 / VKM F-3762 / F11) TaxID=1314773 RepID=A0A3N2Q4Y5_SODAK|nr:sporulation-specific protein [Sodiomyces alkalinus F11]ROT41830.1 sporulation-specific protein [Sodiomyces alkalinus F11]